MFLRFPLKLYLLLQHRRDLYQRTMNPHLILEAQKYDPAIRAVINFKFTHDLCDWLEQFSQTEDLNMVCVDRSEEPSEASKVDGQSMPWKIQKAVELSKNKFPDIIGETEAPGKEPLFKLFGKSAIDVAEKLIKIAKSWVRKKN